MHLNLSEAAQQPSPLASVGCLLNKSKLIEKLGVSSATLTRWANDPENLFPAPLRIGPNRVAWTEKSIVDWLAAVAAQGGQA